MSSEAAPHQQAYRAVMDRVTGLVADLDGTPAADTIVPATPAWRVRDLLAHFCGVPDDSLAGRLEGVTTDAWTTAQIDRRRGRSVGELMAEWESLWPAFSGLLATIAGAMPLVACQIVFDALSHEQDLRGALAEPGGRDAPGWDLSWTFGVHAMGELRDRTDAGAIVLRPTDGDDVVCGSGEPTARVRASRYELLRGATGRRSPAQIDAWTWDGTWTPETFCIFGPRDTDLVE